MAMAAAYFETGGDPEERKALEWLEAQELPEICATEHHERTLVGVYVPVNDKLSLPRGRQERVFPTARPYRDTVFLRWRTDAPSEIREALDRLCGKVTRIGHSSSLAQMWIERGDAPEGADWVSEELAGSLGEEKRLRVAERGSLQYLEREFNGEARAKYGEMAETLGKAKGKEKTQLKKNVAAIFPQGEPDFNRPKLTRWAGYARRRSEEVREEEALRGFFDAESVVVLGKITGERLGLESTLQLTGALRNAAMKAAGDKVPEWLSGHAANGTPTKRPHVAFFPLPFVDNEHADGHVLGLAMAMPREADADRDLRRAIGALLFDKEGADRTICLWKSLGKGDREHEVWRWELRRTTGQETRAGLRLHQWTRPSRLWASATPVVLHHYPKKNRDNHVVEIVGEAFLSAGLPKPVKIAAQPVSYFRGVGHAMEMPDFSEGGENLCRYQTHVLVEFERAVEGPVLVGRGRFRGYGLLRPVRSAEDDERTDSE
jgi:CRISPR-associated protein Csb2